MAVIFVTAVLTVGLSVADELLVHAAAALALELVPWTGWFYKPTITSVL